VVHCAHHSRLVATRPRGPPSGAEVTSDVRVAKFFVGRAEAFRPSFSFLLPHETFLFLPFRPENPSCFVPFLDKSFHLKRRRVILRVFVEETGKKKEPRRTTAAEKVSSKLLTHFQQATSWNLGTSSGPPKAKGTNNNTRLTAVAGRALIEMLDSQQPYRQA
jgi:hypothetical protein